MASKTRAKAAERVSCVSASEYGPFGLVPVSAVPKFIEEWDWDRDPFPFPARRRWLSAHAGKFIHGSTAIVEASRDRDGDFPNCPGIYFLIWHGQIVYVGQSRQVATRLRQHADEGKPFEAAATLTHIPQWALDAFEHAYLEGWRPPWNDKDGGFDNYLGIGSALIDAVAPHKEAVMPWFTPSLTHNAGKHWRAAVIGYRQAHPD